MSIRKQNTRGHASEQYRKPVFPTEMEKVLMQAKRSLATKVTMIIEKHKGSLLDETDCMNTYLIRTSEKVGHIYNVVYYGEKIGHVFLNFPYAEFIQQYKMKPVYKIDL